MNTLPTEQELYDLYHVQGKSVKELCCLLGLKYHYQFYQDDVNDEYMQRVMLENALFFALEKQELYLVYQPKYNLKTNELIAFKNLYYIFLVFLFAQLHEV